MSPAWGADCTSLGNYVRPTSYCTSDTDVQARRAWTDHFNSLIEVAQLIIEKCKHQLLGAEYAKKKIVHIK